MQCVISTLLIICLDILLSGVMPILLPGRQITGNCPYLTLPQGRVRLRQRGKLARFQCLQGYELFGQRYASCINRRWDVPQPACIKIGCPPLPNLDHGYLYYTHNKAAVMYFCEPGYKLMGSEVATCNGVKWNATFPQCVDFVRSPPTSCDFESAILCGWTLDETTTIQWHRTNRKTPSGIYGTGPSWDHTLGPGKNGFYMYIESSTRGDDTARLLSPIYRGNLTQDGCLDFYYHMFGRHIGALRIFMKPENVDIKSIYEDSILRDKYVLFEQSGNLGEQWRHYKTQLTEISQNFQIVIEGLRGSGYLGDVAIDDVSIFQGENCVVDIGTTDKDNNDAIASREPVGKDSCAGRCIELLANTISPDDCQCYDGCVEDNNCCIDYQEICIFSTTTDYITTSGKNMPPTKHPMLPPSLKMTATEITKPEPNITSTVTTKEPSTTSKKPAPTPTTKVTTTTKLTSEEKVPTTTKPTTTTQKVARTTKKITIPQLKFVSPEAPAVNATGRINRPLIFKLPITTASTQRTTVVTVNTTKVTTSTPKKIYPLPHSTTTLKTTSTTKQHVEKYSRTFENYHEFVHRKTLKNDVAEELEHKKMAAVKEAERPISPSISPATIVLEIAIPLLVFIGVLLEIYIRGRQSLFRRIHWIHWQDYRNRREDSSEVRFLTRHDGEEEVDL